MRHLSPALALLAFVLLGPTAVAHARPPAESPLEISVTPRFSFLTELDRDDPDVYDGTEGEELFGIGGGTELAFRLVGPRGHGLHSGIRVLGLSEFCIFSCEDAESYVAATTSVGWIYRAAFGTHDDRPTWFDVTPHLVLEWGVLLADDTHALVGLETGLDFDVHTRRGAIFGVGGGVEALVSHEGRRFFGGSVWLRVGWAGAGNASRASAEP